MRATLGPDGLVTVPLELLQEHGMEPGDEVVFWREDDHIALGAAPPDAPLRGRFASRPLTARLEEARAMERSRGALP